MNLYLTCLISQNELPDPLKCETFLKSERHRALSIRWKFMYDKLPTWMKFQFVTSMTVNEKHTAKLTMCHSWVHFTARRMLRRDAPCFVFCCGSRMYVQLLLNLDQKFASTQRTDAII